MSEQQLIGLVENMIARASSVSDLERLENSLRLCHQRAEKALHNVTVGPHPDLVVSEVPGGDDDNDTPVDEQGPNLPAELADEDRPAPAPSQARAKRLPR
jgi:hypothetical protein